MRYALLFTLLLTLAACAKADDNDVLCNVVAMSYGYTFEDGQERKSDAFRCVERATKRTCIYIVAVSGEAAETDCAGDVLLTR